MSTAKRRSSQNCLHSLGIPGIPGTRCIRHHLQKVVSVVRHKQLNESRTLTLHTKRQGEHACDGDYFGRDHDVERNGYR